MIIVDEFTGRLMPGRRWSGRPAPGYRGQGKSVDPEREPDARVDHFPEFFPHVPQARRHEPARPIRKPTNSRRSTASRLSSFPRTCRWCASTATTRCSARRPKRTRRSSMTSRAASRRAQPGPGRYHVHREFGAALGPAAQAGPGAPGAECQAGMRARPKIIAQGRPPEDDHHRHQHGRPRHRHRARRHRRKTGRSPAGPRRTSSRRKWSAASSEMRSQWQTLHNQVVDAGGLHIIGTERHESRRIDNQFARPFRPAGRSGLLALLSFARGPAACGYSPANASTPSCKRLGMPEGEPIEHSLVTRSIESAQRKVEAHNFDIRKQLLEYDNVRQRSAARDISAQEYRARVAGRLRPDCRSARRRRHRPLPRISFRKRASRNNGDVPGLEKAYGSELKLELPVSKWARAGPGRG